MTQFLSSESLTQRHIILPWQLAHGCGFLHKRGRCVWTAGLPQFHFTPSLFSPSHWLLCFLPQSEINGVAFSSPFTFAICPVPIPCAGDPHSLCWRWALRTLRQPWRVPWCFVQTLKRCGNLERLLSYKPACSTESHSKLDLALTKVLLTPSIS